MSQAGAKSVKRNFAFNAGFTLVNILYPLVSFAYVARIMGPEGMGRINLALSLSTYFVLIATAALPLYGTREIARARREAARLSTIFSELSAVNLLMTAVAVAGYAACFIFSEKMRSDWALFAVSGLLVAANAASFDWFFWGVEDYSAIFYRNVAVKAISLAAVFILVHDRSDYVRYAAIGAAATALYNLWGIAQVRRRIRFRLHDIAPFDHVGSLMLLSGSAITGSVYVYLDSVILGFLAGETALGFYSTAIKITRVAQALSLSLTTAVIPRISYYLKEGRREEYLALSQRSIHFMYFFAFPMLAIMFALAPRLVTLLSGAAFEPAGLTLRITLPLVALGGFTNFLGMQIMFPNGEEKALFIATLCAAALNLGMNFVLIPKLAENGTAVSTLAAEVLAMAILLVLAKREYLGFRLFDWRAARYFGVGCAAGGVGWLVGRLFRNDFLAVPLAGAAGGLAYVGALLLSQDALTKELFLLGRGKVSALFGR
jgi:O-antigen/teichoic acid export membrane protein